MKGLRVKHAWLARAAGLCGAFAVTLAQAAEGARFAAPDVARSAPAGSASGIGQVTFALLVVLAAVFAAAWMVKRLRAVSGAASGIEVVASAALGAKERAVIVRVGETRLLLGVATGGVTLLHTLPPVDPSAAPIPDSHVLLQRPGFAELLKKSLGR